MADPRNLYWANVLTGGGDYALDTIDGVDLADLHMAFVGTATMLYSYILDADDGGSESSPDKIQPDSNAGTKMWELLGLTINNLVLQTVAAAGTDTDKFLVLDSSGNVDYRTGANVLADLSGDAGAAFSFNSQALTGVASVTLPNAGWIGIGAALERLNFYTAGYAAFMGCKVGIGTTSPETALHIATNVGSGVKLERGGLDVRWWGASNGPAYFGTISNDALKFQTNNVDRMTIASGSGYGNVGIGVTDPDQTLEVNGIVHVEDYLYALGGIHIGGTSDPGTDNLVVDGTIGCGSITTANSAVADDAYGLSSIHTLVTNAKSDGIAGYFEGHINGTTDGAAYGLGAWLNIDSGSTLGSEVRGLDVGIYESGATCTGRNAFGLSIHMEFDDTNPPGAIYPLRINCNPTSGHATPDALIFAPNREALAVTEGFPGFADAYMKVKLQDGTVYRMPLFTEGAGDPAAALAALSGEATAAFSFNSQNLTSVGAIGLTSLDIEFKADDCGDIVFKNADDSEKGRVWSGSGAGVNIIYIRGGTTTGLIIDSSGNVNVNSHNASTVGLKLGNTLVTASAAEINLNDGGTAAGSSMMTAANAAAQLALLSGQATAAFSFNSQNLTDVYGILTNNNRSFYWKDSGGTDRRIILITSGNDMQFGPIDAGWGNHTYIKSGLEMHILVNGASGSFTTLVSMLSAGTFDIVTHNASTLGLKLGGTLVTASAAELNYSDGVTSNIQTQLDARCLESVFGISISTGLLLDGTALKTSTVLQIYNGINPSADVQSLLGCADEAAIRTLLDLEVGTDFYSISTLDTALALKAPLDSPTFTTAITIPETAGVADYDKFLVTDTGVIKYRTGTEVLGDIGGLANVVEDTTPQLGGDLEYNEKNQVFNTTLTDDNTASGDIITVTYGESVVFGDLVYADGTADEFLKGLGTNVAVKHPVEGVALETKSDGQSGKMLLRGTIRDATHFSGFAMGDILFLSDGTAGAWLNAAPTTSGDIVQIVGFVIAANYAFFNPDYCYVEIA